MKREEGDSHSFPGINGEKRWKHLLIFPLTINGNMVNLLEHNRVLELSSYLQDRFLSAILNSLKEVLTFLPRSGICSKNVWRE